MEFDWYEIFDLTEFEETGLVSRTLTYSLEGVGEVEILITKGNETAITYDGVFLPIQFLGFNPFIKDGKAVYLDAENNVWLGIETEAE